MAIAPQVLTEFVQSVDPHRGIGGFRAIHLEVSRAQILRLWRRLLTVNGKRPTGSFRNRIRGSRMSKRGWMFTILWKSLTASPMRQRTLCGRLSPTKRVLDRILGSTMVRRANRKRHPKPFITAPPKRRIYDGSRRMSGFRGTSLRCESRPFANLPVMHLALSRSRAILHQEIRSPFTRSKPLKRPLRPYLLTPRSNSQKRMICRPYYSCFGTPEFQYGRKSVP